MAGRPVWARSSFAAMFCDPFTEGTDFGGTVFGASGNLGTSLELCSFLLDRVRQQPALLHLFSESSLKAVADAKAVVDACAVVSKESAGVENVDGFLELLTKWQGSIDSLKPGEMLMIPGGWRNLISANMMVYMVERVSPESFTFIVCNAGDGLEYHPSSACSPPKIKYKTCIR